MRGSAIGKRLYHVMGGSAAMLLLTAGIGSGPAFAYYQCSADGRAVFQDQPCGQDQTLVRQIAPPPAPKAAVPAVHAGAHPGAGTSGDTLVLGAGVKPKPYDGDLSPWLKSTFVRAFAKRCAESNTGAESTGWNAGEANTFCTCDGARVFDTMGAGDLVKDILLNRGQEMVKKAVELGPSCVVEPQRPGRSMRNR